ncbi:DsbC family protein [Variovorax dokdonensis]|uniref:Thiol:disulfide interchange protein n=1 Tax=Variovorax dokdonensis TaxID=344883 RepID=A0ABT7N572_9BURK|nr:DsbC family protein [Variovorax dokdonensis]MDM0043099.1 DsbC family protein [Variovorax dokdonensis]
MKPSRLLAAALACAAACIAVSAVAGEAEIRKNLGERFPQFQKIDEVRKTPIDGLFEVRVGSDIFYVDAQGNYLMQGEMIDIKARRNLTQERVDKLNEVAFDKLPLQDAFKIVRGNGQRKLAVFEDPNCGYCKHFEKDLQKVDNVTVYLFLYPVLGPDSHTKSRDIWCSKDKGKAWNDWMLTQAKPTTAPASCNADVLARNVAFGRKYNISGTPTLIFADGSRIPGAVPAEQVEQKLAAIKN